MDRYEKAAEAVRLMKKAYPLSECALKYRKDYELMIAVRLSAQCTDARVNLITPELFARFPTLHSFAAAKLSEVEDIVKPCGFYHHKAADIIAACKMLEEEYEGTVPDSMDALLRLPGVGRKTANLLLGDLYHRPAVVCDTHCIRITNRLGLAFSKEPEKVERQLWEVLPPDESSDFCHRIVMHGRSVCKAQRPDCSVCNMLEICDYGSERIK